MGDRTSGTPVKVRKLGHLILRVRDIEVSTRFYTEVMGFTVSDRNEHGYVFLRCAADHHVLGLAPADEDNPLPDKSRRQRGFDHCAFEVGSLAELIEIRDFLHARGVPIVFEGRKGPGCNPGLEFLDPDGYDVELYTGMDQIGWDGKARPAEQWRRVRSLEEAAANPVG
ncbi:VOC family protein [Kribbella solani]|uniref:Catechol 2,3-dioxygenase n=1 Tax=Kribbella solani TaxID=236067 RepID=A0A841DQ55_9ACTN|nr:VOC family protein [Kribbella solani]MBB5980031.1 catechol 2,3-dioxygenase [Kribbella solani]